MKKTLVAVLLTAFGLLLAGQAFATSTQCEAVPLINNVGATIPGIKFTTPSLADGDNAYCIFNVQRLFSLQAYAAATGVSTIGWGANFTAAGDSLAVNIAGGWCPDGPWVTAYAYTLQANTIYATTNAYQFRTAAALSTLMPFPYMKVTVYRGHVGTPATMTARDIYVVFPQFTTARTNSTLK